MAGKKTNGVATVLGDCFRATGGTFAYSGSGGAISLDVGAHNDFAQTDTLGGATVATLTGGVDGSRGKLFFVQDGTGRALSIAASGRTVKLSAAISTSANALICVEYHLATLNSVAYLFGDPRVMA